jgi:hypothetical protein
VCIWVSGGEKASKKIRLRVRTDSLESRKGIHFFSLDLSGSKVDELEVKS